jgi:hypothetical protein
MTIRADLLALTRSAIDEASAGFFSDNVDLYPFLNAGQNQCIENLLSVQRQMRGAKDPYYEVEALKNLLKSSDITAGTQAIWHLDYITPTARIVLTAVQRGTIPNAYIVYDANGTLGVSATYDLAGILSITITIASTSSTCQNVIDAINNHPVVGNLLVATTSTPTVKPVVAGAGYAINTNGTGSANFTLPTDILEIHSAELIRTSATADTLPITYVPLSDMRKRYTNTWTGHKYDTSTHRGEVLCALNSSTTLITSFTTWDTYWEFIRLYYYGKPTAIGANQDPTLPSQCFEAIVEYAVYYAFLKDKLQIAYQHKQQADQLITKLCN